MSVSTTAIPITSRLQAVWLRSRGWDLTWITFSIFLVPIPYLIYLSVASLPGVFQPVADLFGTTLDDLSRNLVNAVVALLVGGPHMYATFTRTALDHEFARRHPKFLWSSLVIPVIVTALALLNLSALLTLFFFWASIHVLHQIIYIVELYYQRQPSRPRLFSRLADYGVVLTALYPVAAWKLANGTFQIGHNNITSVVSSIVPLGPWMVWLAGGAFGLALAVWLLNNWLDWRQGRLFWPKVLFILLTALVAFMVPGLGNLDTAFQGMNVWHSLQYLALTWMLNRLREERGELKTSPFVERLSGEKAARSYYLFNIGLTLADVVLALAIFVVLRVTLGMAFDHAFDRAYYIAVLSFLWIHYYHDHFLFTQPKVIRA
jgi:hypothetical protein